MKILLALDNSACSETVIQALMSQFTPAGNEVRVFQAVDWEPHLPIPYQFAQGPDAALHVLGARDSMVQLASDYLAGIVKRLRDAGFTATSEVSAEGNARDAILEAAADWPADLVVVGSHGRSGLDRLFLGSVSEGVVRRAPCSVQVVRSSHVSRPTTVRKTAAQSV
jgi:nucleotide-binding universal stress UspA family protein